MGGSVLSAGKQWVIGHGQRTTTTSQENFVVFYAQDVIPVSVCSKINLNYLGKRHNT